MELWEKGRIIESEKEIEDEVLKGKWENGKIKEDGYIVMNKKSEVLRV